MDNAIEPGSVRLMDAAAGRSRGAVRSSPGWG